GAAELASALADGAGALAAHARELRDALAADYTYLQAAQPATAGHPLLAYAYPALRDAERLQHAHRELSRSVAGVGGSAGSRSAPRSPPPCQPLRGRRPRALTTR